MFGLPVNVSTGCGEFLQRVGIFFRAIFGGPSLCRRCCGASSNGEGIGYASPPLAVPQILAMPSDAALPLILIVAFPIFFGGMWWGTLMLLSALGGWARLAETFSAREAPAGRCFSMQDGMVGWVSYNACLSVSVSAEGLHLSVMFPFRVGHPPLFIPWTAVRSPRIRRFLWAESVAFDAGSPSVATVRLPKRIFEGRDVSIT